MTDQIPTKREMALDLEVARLKAEISDLRGDGSVEATSRFLALAASTIDVAMEEARQESDKARAQASEITSSALADVVAIKARAKCDALAIVDDERRQVADEIEALQQVRRALESERHELEDYHAELRRRVQVLAESMVSFMSTEPPVAAMTVIEEMSPPEPREVMPPTEFSGVPVMEVEQGPSMFSRVGNWLEIPRDQPPTEDMASARNVDEMVEEQKFEAFIDGDEDDKSRDWLLQHEID